MGINWEYFPLLESLGQEIPVLGYCWEIFALSFPLDFLLWNVVVKKKDGIPKYGN